MQIRISRRSGKSGGVLMVVCCVVAIAGISMAGYFTIVQSQTASVARSQAWNNALIVSEAGIEDGLGLVNSVLPGGFSTGWEWTNTVTTDGWSDWSGGVTSVQRLVNNSNSYTVTVTLPAGGGNPIIESVGVVPYTAIPWVFSSASQPYVASAGVAAAAPVNQQIARKVRINTARSRMFPVAIAAKDVVKFSGGPLVDSYDSNNTNYSTGGLYDPAKSRDQAIVATDAAIVNAIAGSGGVRIKGSVATGPGGLSGMNGNSSVGDSAWVNGGYTGIQTNHGRDDMNVVFYDVQSISTGGMITPSAVNVGGTNITTLSGTGTKYLMPVISMSSSDQIKVTGQNVVLYVIGNISISGQAAIILAPGASLKLYCAGSSVNMSGGGIVNPGSALNFSFLGLPSCTSVSYSGSAAFTGTIYAPEAAVSMSGTSDIYGACVCRKFTDSGGANFHYDEALGNIGPYGPFIASDWLELAYP